MNPANKMSEVRFDRMLLLIGLLLYSSWGWIYSVTLPEATDPVSIRASVSILMLITLILSYKSIFVVRKFTQLLYTIIYIVTLQQIYLAYINSFTSEFLIIYIVLVFTLSPYFKTIPALGCYLLFSLVLTFLPLFFNGEEYEVSPEFFVSSVFTLLALVFPILSGRLRTQKKLFYQKTLMDSIFNGVSDSLILVNPDDLTIVDCNDCTYKMFGLDRLQSLKRSHITKILSLSFNEETVEKVRESISAKGVFKYECEQVSTRGKRFWTDMVTTYILAAGRELWLFRLTDITERKNADQEISRKSDELHRKNEELGQFAYVASHDLKEPLRTVTSYLQLLQKRYADKLDTSAQDFINYAVNGAVRMHALINDLLSFSRVEVDSGRREKVDLNSLISRIKNDLSALMGESNGTIEVSGDMPVINADPLLINQLFTNLISNGLKYHHKNKPGIVKVLYKDEGQYYKFTIRDNGIGISPEFRDKVFVIFQRLHSRDEYSGTGIGLAICKKIVDLYGGRIWIESNGEGGSDFHFTFKKS